MRKDEQSYRVKTRGRPKREIGVDPLVAARFPKAILDRLGAWALQYDQTRSAAVRSLVELGLTVKPETPPRAQDKKIRAKELAGKAIDKIIDIAVIDKVMLERKRRLLKGPEEFRDARVDRKPK